MTQLKIFRTESDRQSVHSKYCLLRHISDLIINLLYIFSLSFCCVGE